jgi:hypothetical protein
VTREDRWAAGLIAGGVALRVAALLSGTPPTNSDEATMGLAARHIAAGQERPAFFYGQHYMGTLEAYLAAPLFALFGSSTGLLRVQTLAWYVLLCVAVYRLCAVLYSRRLGLVCLALLALGSDRVLKNQLIAAGGYPEIVPLAALLMLGAVLLARGPAPTGRARALLGYAGWGFGAGLALWDDWIVLPYLAAAGLLLAAFRGRELLRAPGAALLAGALLGAGPLLWENLSGRSSSVRVLLDLNRAGAAQAAGASLAEHVRGGVLVGVPMAGGLCPPGRCGPAQTWWGLAYVLLLAVAGALAVAALRRAGRPGRGGAAGRARPATVRQAGRLALVAAAAVTLVSYARSPTAALAPVESARYLAILGVSLPAVGWPPLLARRWAALAAARRGTRSAPGAAPAGSPVRLVGAAATAVLGAVALLSLVATAAAFGVAGTARAGERAQRDLAAALGRLGVRAVYSDYWTCGRLVFATRERVACAVVEDDLRRGNDRYPPYRDRVAAAARPAYALRAGSPAQTAFAARLAWSGVTVAPVRAGPYLLYVPDAPVGVPLP